jgi:hypothetical protein
MQGLSHLFFARPMNSLEASLMWDDPIVEETRKLRDAYAAKHGYNVHKIAEDLRQWEKQGFPMAANPNKALKPTVLLSLPLRQNDG